MTFVVAPVFIHFRPIQHRVAPGAMLIASLALGFPMVILQRIRTLYTRNRTAAQALSMLLLILILWVAQPSRIGLWSVRLIDAVVIAVVIAGLFISYRVYAQREQRADNIGNSFTILMLALTAFVTYASFRNQSRLAAEQILTTEGIDISAMEMGEKNFRCLYSNFGFDNPALCVQRIIKDEESRTTAIFYVETVWWILETSRDHEKSWGAAYSDSIEYWREFVKEDPTGMFSYYMISFSESEEGAINGMRRAGVLIPYARDKYCKVYAALAVRRAQPDPIISCSA